MADVDNIFIEKFSSKGGFPFAITLRSAIAIICTPHIS